MRETPLPTRTAPRSENNTITLVVLLSCSVDVPRSQAPRALTDKGKGAVIVLQQSFKGAAHLCLKALFLCLKALRRSR